MDGNNDSDIFDFYLSVASHKIMSGTTELTDANFVTSTDNNMAAEGDDFSDVFGDMAMQDFENDLISFSNSDSESASPEAIKEISDEQIKELPVQELNKLLRNLPRDTVAKIRKRRRNLKNRGYALTCRLRRVQQYVDLENENVKLKSELEAGKENIRKILSEKESYKRRYLLLKKVFTANRKSFKIPAGWPVL